MLSVYNLTPKELEVSILIDTAVNIHHTWRVSKWGGDKITQICSCLFTFLGGDTDLGTCWFFSPYRPVDPCSPNPCENGAICSTAPDGNSSVCTCAIGYFGPTCQNRGRPARLDPSRIGPAARIAGGGASKSGNASASPSHSRRTFCVPFKT